MDAVDISSEQINKGLSFDNFMRLINMQKIMFGETPYINAKRMYPFSDETLSVRIYRGSVDIILNFLHFLISVRDKMGMKIASSRAFLN
ncbi:hypothetical protein ACR9GP_21570 [Enterobacter ludwigii]